MTNDELRKGLALIHNVTPGEWRPSNTKPPGPDALKVWAPHPEGIAGYCSEICVLIGNKAFPERAEADVEFVAWAKNNVEWLIEEVLRAREDRYRE